MLELLQSNRMSLLLETLSERLQQPDDPFEPALVVVQSQGIGQWLKVELAKRQGIAANIDCLLPAELIWRLYQTVLPPALGTELPSDSPFSRNLLRWRLMEMLPAHPERSIRKYLKGPGDPELRRFQLGHAVASLFDQYLIYRPDWVYQWETSDEHAELKWQSDLWRELIALPDLDPKLHRANLHRLFLNRLQNPAVASELPKQINVLGVSSLPKMHLETLQAVAEHNQVAIYFLNPCEHYWGDIASEKQLAKKRSIREIIQKTGPLEADDYLEVGNPLLSSTGQQGREFLELLLETDGIQTADIFQSVDPSTALSQIQSDLLNLEFGGEYFELEMPTDPLILDSGDRSIQIHSAHSRMREVEILLDQLLAMLEDNPDLNPSDIIVMAPDISQYAPFIEAVFQTRLPFSITDRPVVDESAILVAFQKLMSLPDMRMTATEVMDLLEVPAIANCFELGEADISRLHRWVKESGIRFEIDGTAKQNNWQLADDDYNTWRFGLDRLLLGLAMEPESGLHRGTAPMDLNPSDAELLGKLCDFVELLEKHRQRLTQPHTALDWQASINQLLLELISPTLEEEFVMGYISDALAALVTEHENSQFSETISPRLFRYWLDQALNQPAQNRGFVSGGITFATLVPMRSIPYECICLLGMNDREFPREDKPLSFDLMANQYRKGDRSRRNDDRYLFLEAIMSAKQTLYVSYIGRGQKDNKEKPPSELLSELIDYLERIYGEVPITEHPLQPFNERYFQNTNLFSYASHWQTALSADKKATEFAKEALASNSELEQLIHIDQLTRFYRHPAKYFLNQRLGVYFNEDMESLKDTESFALDGLERYQLADQALRTLLMGHSIDSWTEQVRASGNMLPGQLGDQQLKTEINLAAEVAAAVKEITPHLAETHGFEIELLGQTVYCELPLHKGQYLAPRTGALRARQKLEAWIHHLTLCISGYDQDSIMVFRKGSGKRRAAATESFTPVSPDEAKHNLEQLAGWFKLGLNKPLAFLPEASLVYAKTDSIEDVLKSLVAEQVGSESTDPYYQRVFDFSNDFGEPFKEIAKAIWHPALAHGGD